MSRGRSGGPLSEMEAKAWPALLPHWPVGAGASALAAAGRRVGARRAPCASPAGACVDWRREIRQVWTASRGLVDPHDRGCCRRLSDTRERPGPLKDSPEGAVPGPAPRQKVGEARGSDRASLGASAGEARSVGYKCRTGSLDNPMGFGLFGGLCTRCLAPGPGWCSAGGMLAWRARAR